MIAFDCSKYLLGVVQPPGPVDADVRHVVVQLDRPVDGSSRVGLVFKAGIGGCKIVTISYTKKFQQSKSKLPVQIMTFNVSHTRSNIPDELYVYPDPHPLLESAESLP